MYMKVWWNNNFFKKLAFFLCRIIKFVGPYLIECYIITHKLIDSPADEQTSCNLELL